MLSIKFVIVSCKDGRVPKEHANRFWIGEEKLWDARRSQVVDAGTSAFPARIVFLGLVPAVHPILFRLTSGFRGHQSLEQLRR